MLVKLVIMEDCFIEIQGNPYLRYVKSNKYIKVVVNIYTYIYIDVRSWNNLKEKKRKGKPVARNNERLISAPEALLQSTALLSYAVGH